MPHFRVRYAYNQGRFAACKLCERVEISHDEPQSFPQNKQKHSKLYDHQANRQSEDAFFVEIWSPESAKSLPVMFWIHGGSFSSGSNYSSQNNMQNLAEQAQIVIVSVAYRLGFLGTANFNGISQANCGFHDIATALEWTQKHIHNFGGNAQNVTVAGQSSGAWYAMAIHTAKNLQYLFQKTMLFSFPNMQAIEQTLANQITDSFSDEIFRICKTRNLQIAPIQAIIQAQKIVGKRNAKQHNFLVPFMPSAEDGFISADFFEATKSIQKPLYVQFTADECGAYVYKYPIGKRIPSFIIARFLKKYCPNDALQKLRESRRYTHNTYLSAIEVSSHELFEFPAIKIVQNSPQATLHKFDFESKNSKTLCCHCFDLPFIFGNFSAWQSSRMFRDCEYSEIQTRTKEMQKIIRDFCYS